VTIELWQLFLVGIGYLLLLFLIAYAADNGKLPAHWARHPLTYVLSLGVYATSWSFYGSVGFAASQGYNFLTIYLGVTLAFMLTPVLLQPILRLTREYQLSSLADLFAFRYQSQLAGVLVTLFMLAGTLPYIALQVRAVTESIQVLTREAAPGLLALGFCLTVTLFAVLFGARHSSAREKHEGLVLAIAFESLVKLLALLAVGLFALFGVFDGPSGMEQWLTAHPEALQALYRPVREGSWGTLLLLAFSAAFLLPRQFHMTFTENLNERALGTASWGFPLFLLLLNLAIPPILWAGTYLDIETSPDFYVLGITLTHESSLLPIITFIGGLSAASAMIIVTTLALASMCMNHLVLPASFPPLLRPETDIYRWLLWGRRLLIALIIGAGYVFYLVLEHNQGLAQLGLISFVAVAQFLPGIVGLLYWRRATRAGFITGLLGGGTVWAASLLLPLLERSGLLAVGLDHSIGFNGAGPHDPWQSSTLWSLSINSLLFVLVSLLTRPSEEEREIAESCCKESLTPLGGRPVAASVQQIEEQLGQLIGGDMARHEVDRARSDLGLLHAELRSGDLARLRQQIERNLSGLIGPLLARMIVDERLELDPKAAHALSDTVQFVEQRLEASDIRLRGLAAELDHLRRYHRQVLQDLPLGVCSVGPERRVVSWNEAMGRLSGLYASQLIGAPLAELPVPWGGLLSHFLQNDESQLRHLKLQLNGETRVLNLHKSIIADPTTSRHGSGTVILVEDLTELHTLEEELTHSERLASIGRLAAGVAHEIGNPVTGIACLTQELLHESDDPAFRRQGLQQILEQTRRISNIVQSLVNFSHGGTLHDHTPEPVELGNCIEEALQLVRLSRSGKQLETRIDCPQPLQVEGDRQRLIQVFVNLLTNACDASQPGDTLSITGRIEGDYVVVRLSDQGHGIPATLQEKIFEPFFTTKPAGEGTGLGLPLAYSIVQQHSGSLTVKSHQSGTTFTLRLPHSHSESSA
jgi:PAS domain S-box-containing protein